MKTLHYSVLWMPLCMAAICFAADINPQSSIFSVEQALNIETLLSNQYAKTMPSKSVWVIRESGTFPGALNITYFDKLSQSHDGFVSRTYVYNENSKDKWVLLSAELRAIVLKNLEYDFFRKINIKTMGSAELDKLFEVLAKEGFAKEGLMRPEKSKYYF